MFVLVLRHQSSAPCSSRGRMQVVHILADTMGLKPFLPYSPAPNSAYIVLVPIRCVLMVRAAPWITPRCVAVGSESRTHPLICRSTLGVLRPAGHYSTTDLEELIVRRSMLACVSMVFNRVDTSPDSVDAISATSSVYFGAARHTVPMMAPMCWAWISSSASLPSSCMHVGR